MNNKTNSNFEKGGNKYVQTEMQLLILLLLNISATSFADDNWCRDIAGSSGSYNLAIAVKSSSFYVDSDSEYPNTKVKNCPGVTDNCIDKYNHPVAKNTRLIVGKQYHNMICAYDVANGTAGWLPVRAVRLEPETKSNDNQISGKWHSTTAEIVFTKKLGGYAVTGSAKWYGGPNGDIIHTGEFAANIAESEIKTGIGTLNDSDTGCRINFNLVANKYLVVDDNNQCGGVNVRFNDVFTR